MIVRIAKRRKFAQIDNRTLEDPRLTLEATGLLGYLLSKPDGWQARKTDLVRRAGGNYRAVRRAMRLLVQLGYATLEPARGENGKLTGTAYVIYERPCTESIKNRRSAAPTLGCTDARLLDPLSNTDKRSNTEAGDNSGTQRASNTDAATRSREKELFASVAEILGESEMNKNGGMWRTRIRGGPDQRRALKNTIEDYKIRTPDQRQQIRNLPRWFTDRYRRNLVKISPATRTEPCTPRA